MYTFQPTSVLEPRLSVVVVRGSISIAMAAGRAFLILLSFLLHLQQHQMHNPKRKTEIIGTPITINMNPVPPKLGTQLSTLESSSSKLCRHCSPWQLSLICRGPALLGSCSWHEAIFCASMDQNIVFLLAACILTCSPRICKINLL